MTLPSWATVAHRALLEDRRAKGYAYGWIINDGTTGGGTGTGIAADRAATRAARAAAKACDGPRPAIHTVYLGGSQP